MKKFIIGIALAVGMAFMYILQMLFSKPSTVINNAIDNTVKKMKVKGKNNRQDTSMKNDVSQVFDMNNGKTKKEERQERRLQKKKARIERKSNEN